MAKRRPPPPPPPKGMRGAFARLATATARRIGLDAAFWVTSGVEPGPSQVAPVGFEGASMSPRLSPWIPSRLHLNALLAAEGPRLRARTRQLVANTAHGASASETFVAYAVGTGITPSPDLPDAQRSQIKRAWTDWTDEADADGLTDYYGLQALVARAMFDAGECFVRLRPRFAADGLSVPIQLQLLEAEQLDQGFNQDLGNGNVIRQGIEFSPIGKRLAYHFWTRHPGDNDPRGLSLDRTRVPADSVLHIFKPLRPGQIRGKPWLTAGMVRLHDLDEYEDAELNRKRGAAMNMAFLTRDLGEAPDGLTDGAVPDDSGIANVVMEPSTIHVLPQGVDVKFNEPADVGPNFEAFAYRNLLGLCASMGLPYFSVTGDTSKANYSSLRSALLDLKRRIEQFQHETLVFQFCRPVYRWFLEAAILAGTIRLPLYATSPVDARRCRWIPPRWEWVDPLKDVQAEEHAVDANFKARDDVILERGEDPRDVDERIAQGEARKQQLEEKYGVKFPSGSPKAIPGDQAPAAGGFASDAQTPPESGAQPAEPAPGTSQGAAA